MRWLENDKDLYPITLTYAEAEQMLRKYSGLWPHGPAEESRKAYEFAQAIMDSNVPMEIAQAMVVYAWGIVARNARLGHSKTVRK